MNARRERMLAELRARPEPFLAALIFELSTCARGEYVAAGNAADQAAVRLQAVNEIVQIAAKQLRTTRAGAPAYPVEACVAALVECARMGDCEGVLAAAADFAARYHADDDWRRRPSPAVEGET